MPAPGAAGHDNDDRKEWRRAAPLCTDPISAFRERQQRLNAPEVPPAYLPGLRLLLSGQGGTSRRRASSARNLIASDPWGEVTPAVTHPLTTDIGYGEPANGVRTLICGVLDRRGGRFQRHARTPETRPGKVTGHLFRA